MADKSILMFADWFEPGYKAGGPIRSCVNFARHMKDAYRVFIFTSDRDLGEDKPYPGIEADTWLLFEPGIHVYYCSPSKLNYKNIRQQSKQVNPDFIYLNSMFSVYFTIYPLFITRLLRGGKKVKTILAPRGMLKESALQYKKTKKTAFLQLFNWSGIHRLLHFHATDETEALDIRRVFGSTAQVTLIGNFPGYPQAYKNALVKEGGQLRIIFIGRIHPIKNLDFLIRLLNDTSGNILLTIVGGEEDRSYSKFCSNLAAECREHVTIQFAGEIPHHEINSLLHAHHIFALPTNGENFGHAIFEALSAGKPVLISDQTPWRMLEQHEAGWDLPLQQPELFVQAINKAVQFDQNTYNCWSRKSWEFVHQYIQQTNFLSHYQRLFN